MYHFQNRYIALTDLHTENAEHWQISQRFGPNSKTFWIFKFWPKPSLHLWLDYAQNWRKLILLVWTEILVYAYQGKVKLRASFGIRMKDLRIVKFQFEHHPRLEQTLALTGCETTFQFALLHCPCVLLSIIHLFRVSSIDVDFRSCKSGLSWFPKRLFAVYPLLLVPPTLHTVSHCDRSCKIQCCFRMHFNHCLQASCSISKWCRCLRFRSEQVTGKLDVGLQETFMPNLFFAEVAFQSM